MCDDYWGFIEFLFALIEVKNGINARMIDLFLLRAIQL